MIDAEDAVFDAVSKHIRKISPKAFLSSEYVDAPARFPAVTLLQADSSVYQKMRTASIENADEVMFEANVYSNRMSGKKAEAKKLMDAVDETMARLGFTRTMRSPTSNLQDATIYRIVARYQGVIDKDLWIYTG